MDKQKGLGRGLSSLIPDLPLEAGKTVLPQEKAGEVNINQVLPNPAQPRKSFAQKELEELASSIRKHGILQPILVRKSGDKYEIIAGERRWRASKLAGLNKVSVVIQNVDKKETLELALIENIQREDLNCIEEAEAYQGLIGAFSYTQAEVAEKVGKDRSHIANTLRLLNLPEAIKEAIISGRISMGHARAFLSLSTEKEQNQGLEEVLEKKLNVRDTEKLIREKKDPFAKKSLPPDLRAVEDQLRGLLKTKVILTTAKKNRGKITIEYYSKEDLIRLVDLFQKMEA